MPDPKDAAVAEPDAAEPEDPARRRFLGYTAAAVGVAAGTLVAAPAALSLVGAVGRRNVLAATDYLDVGGLAEFVVDKPRRVVLRGMLRDSWLSTTVDLGAAWIVRRADGTLTAYSAICPHLGCAVDGGETKDEPFVCPCHDSAFSLAGECLKGPSPRGLDPLKVRALDGRVQVQFRRFVVGVSERVEV